MNFSATEALGKINGYFTDHIIQVIRTSIPDEKLAALKAAYSQGNLSRDDKASIALVALDIGLYSEPAVPAEEGVLRELRYESVRELTALNWAGETDNLVKHFDNTVFVITSYSIHYTKLYENGRACTQRQCRKF